MERPAEIVYGENNEVYMRNPVTPMYGDCYIKGTKNGNVLHFDLPQLVQEGWSSYYVTKMQRGESINLNYVEVTENNFVEYVIDGEFITLDFESSLDDQEPQYILSAAYKSGDQLAMVNGGDFFQDITLSVLTLP